MLRNWSHCLANCTFPFGVLLPCKGGVPLFSHGSGHAERRIDEPGTAGRHRVSVERKPFLA